MKIVTIQGHDGYDVLGMRKHLILSNGKYYMDVYKCTLHLQLNVYIKLHL